MEYVILIIVIAVLALLTGGYLLFLRPRRGRVAAPSAAPPVPPAPAPGGTGTETETAAAEPPAATAAVLEVERPPPSAGRMVRLRARLARSQSSLGSALLNLLSRDRLDDETWDEMEEVLITADVGVAVARVMVDDLKTKVKVLGVHGPADARAVLRDVLITELATRPGRCAPCRTPTPAVLLVVGVNGTGKTTTVGKLARVLVADGRRVVLGAADTFRAAAADQLQTWASRVGAEVVRGPPRAPTRPRWRSTPSTRASPRVPTSWSSTPPGGCTPRSG